VADENAKNSATERAMVVGRDVEMVGDRGIDNLTVLVA
jgi:hypothetical protein